MLWLQLKFEYQQWARQPLAWLLLLLLAGSIGIGTFYGRQALHKINLAAHQHQAAFFTQLAENEALADSISQGLATAQRWWADPTHPLAVGHFRRGGLVLTTTPPPLGLLAAGLRDLQPEAHRINFTSIAPLNSSYLENPVNQLFVGFDLAFVLVYLLPLFVLAFSYNLIAAEREQGTLGLLWSQPLSPTTLFGHRMLARFLLLCSLTLGSLWLALAAAGIMPNQPGMGALALGVVCYMLFWFVLALAINLLQRSAAFNALSALGAWLVCVVALPAILSTVGALAAPIPARGLMQVQVREAEHQAKLQREQILAAYYQRNPSLIPNPDEAQTERKFWLEYLVLEDHTQTLRNQIVMRYDSAADHQAAWMHQARTLSPALVFYDYLAELSGSDRTSFLRQRLQLEQRQAEWAQFFRDRFAQDLPIAPADYAQIKAWAQPLPPASQPTGHNLAWLLGYTLALMALAWVLATRRPFSLQAY